MSSAPNATMLQSSTPIHSSQIASRTQAWRELGGIVSGRRFHGVISCSGRPAMTRGSRLLDGNHFIAYLDRPMEVAPRRRRES